MKKSDNRKILLPKTPFGVATVAFFCLIWWLLNNKPVMQFFDNMVKDGDVVWLLGMPINFAFIIGVAILSTIWTIIMLAKWEVGDDDE